MTDREINRASLNKFLVRCIGHGSAVALDAEHGLRVLNVCVLDGDAGGIGIELDNGHFVIIDIEHHLVPRTQKTSPEGTHANAPARSL